MSKHDEQGGQGSGLALPPRPDPQTGEPFPPHGLAYLGRDDKPEDDPGRETRVSHRPDPPAGMGPTLVWHRENTRGRVVLVLVAFALLVAGAGVLSLLKYGDLQVYTAWPVWIILVLGTVLISSPFSTMTHSAGADWYQVQRNRLGIKKSNHIKLYELTKIRVNYGGTTLHLEMHDGDNGTYRSFEELQKDRRMWDLIYNGILHSVANGATISNQAIGALDLLTAAGPAIMTGRNGPRA